MIQDAKAIEFFEGVLSKTKAGRIRWEPTAEGSEYIAAIGGQFTLSISERNAPDTFPLTINAPYTVSPLIYALVLRDHDGRELTKLTNFHENIPEKNIRELYDTARRQALRIDEKIETVIGELSKL